MEETNLEKLDPKRRQIVLDIMKILDGKSEEEIDGVLEALENRKFSPAEPEKVDSVRPMTPEEMVMLNERVNKIFNFFKTLGLYLVTTSITYLLFLTLCLLSGDIDRSDFLMMSLNGLAITPSFTIPFALLTRFVRDIREKRKKKKETKENPKNK